MSLFIFHHLIKTGGTSVNRWIEACLPENQRLNAGDASPKGLAVLENRLASRTEGLSAIYGHAAHHAVPYVQDTIHGVVTRHPVEYSVSRYVFDRMINENRGNPDARQAVLPGEAPLDEVLEKILEWGEVPNYNTCAKHMAECARAIDPTLRDPITIGDVPALLNAFDHVGVTDQLPLYCFLISERMDWLLKPVGRENTTNSHEIYLPLWFRDEIERRSNVDLELYHQACRKLDNAAATLFNKSVEAFRKFQDYRSLCA